ncbi:MAG: hypothetical protein KGJ57_21210 [Sphingomonadales bacterium]|nr:hypothetical protein [Sphingomonadales bacterium]MDE2171916.1 hypothetical protein [Sphingomonadales bacterium]
MSGPFYANSCASLGTTLLHRSKVFLADVGVLRKPKGRYVFPGDGTLLAIWNDWCLAGVQVDGKAPTGAVYRRVRRMLFVTHLPHPPGAPLEREPRPDDKPYHALVSSLCSVARKRLLDDGILQLKPGRIAADESKYIYPGDGTKLALWQDMCARGFGINGNRKRFEVYRRVRSTLEVNDLPHTDEALLELVKFAGDQRITRRLITTMIGFLGKEISRDTDDRIAELTGKGFKPKAARSSGTLDDLLAIFPEGTRSKIAKHLDRKRIPVITPPSKEHIGRLLQIGKAPLQLLGACILVAACGERKSYGTKKRLVGYVERFADIIPEDALGHPEKLLKAWEDYASGAILPHDSELIRHTRANAYSGTIDSAERLAELVLGDDAYLVTELLPARLADEASFNLDRRKAQRKLEEKARSEKVVEVLDLVPRFIEVLGATNNRLHQVESILAACRKALPHARARLEAGLDAGFEVEGLVVRADGTLGGGKQVVSFRFELESTLLTRAHRSRPGDIDLERLMPYGESATGALGWTGLYHRPEHWNRIHLVYETTRPSETGGECVEPFFIDLFRWGMLEPDTKIGERVSQERRERLLDAGIPLCVDQVDGLLCNPVSRRAVARHARGPDPDRGAIVVPLVEFYHAMCYGWLIVHYGIRWGARFAETQQIRLGPDCFRTHTVGGKKKAYMALKPKNWADHGKFGLDASIAGALRTVNRLSIARWFQDERDEKGDPTLPVRPFGSSDRPDLPPARYIFAARHRGLDAAELMHYVHVLLIGILDAGSHIGRYVFATALGLDGTGYEEQGWLMHHNPGSAVTKRYDLSAMIDSDDAATRHSANVDADLLGRCANG